MKDIAVVLIFVALGVFLMNTFAKPKADERFDVPVEFADALSPIRRASIDPADAVKLAAFYRDFARIVEKDVDHRLRSAADIKTLNERSGKYCFDIKGKYPALADAIDGVLALGIGTKRTADGFEDVPLTDTSRKNLAIALRAIASSF
jgi:hypothetical protein